MQMCCPLSFPNKNRFLVMALLVSTGIVAGPILEAADQPPQTDDAAAISKRVEQLVKDLSSKDGQVRGRAAFQLGKYGERAAPAIPHLMNLFGDLLAPIVDPSHNHGRQISSVAMMTLAKIGEPAVEPLIAAMLDKKRRRDVRGCSAQVLGRIKDPRAIAPLIQALGDDYQGLRLFASLALQRIGKPAFEKLVPLLNDKNPYLRLGATRGISEIKDKRVTELLIERLGDEHHSVRYAAAAGLGSRKSEKPAVDALIAAIDDPHDDVRSNIFTALCRTDDPRLVKRFLAGLNDPYKFVRCHAAGGLGWQKSKEAVEPLLAALRSDDRSFRSSAARALGKIGDVRALKPLIRLARTDPDRSVRQTAGRAIGELEHPKQRASEIAWGEPVEGVQLGLQCTSGKRSYRHGEVIRYRRVIRNHSTRDWKFRIDTCGRVFPHAKDGKISLHTGTSISGGPISVRTVTIAAGGTDEFDATDFTLRPKNSQLSDGLSVLRVEPGKYKVSTGFSASFFGAKGPDVFAKHLTSGELELVVRADEK